MRDDPNTARPFLPVWRWLTPISVNSTTLDAPISAAATATEAAKEMWFGARLIALPGKSRSYHTNTMPRKLKPISSARSQSRAIASFRPLARPFQNPREDEDTKRLRGHHWRRGLDPPPVVKVATKEYLEAEDALSAWIDEAGHRDLNAFANRHKTSTTLGTNTRRKPTSTSAASANFRRVSVSIGLLKGWDTSGDGRSVRGSVFGWMC
jgi:hypothetical protein